MQPLHRRGRYLILVAALLILLFSHPLVHGDGLAHFMYLDTIAGDGDLDLSNQAVRFDHANQYQIFALPTTGQLVTAFPFGSAYLLAPFYWLGRTVEPYIQVNRAYFHDYQGLSLAFSLTGSLGALCYAVAAVWLAYQTARRLTSDTVALIAALACFMGTPLLFYATMEPLGSHTYGAMLISCALWIAVRYEYLPASTAPLSLNPARALVLGLVLGMAMLVRWQLVLYAIPVGIALLGWSTVTRFNYRVLGLVIAFALGVGLFIGLCITYFRLYFGSPLFIPTEAQSGQPFIGNFLHALPQVLFDGQNGWLTWSPIVLPGLVGLIALARSRLNVWRVVAAVSLAGIGLELALNASLYDWYGGWAFGQRRMTEAYGPLVLGTAWFLRTSSWRRAGRRGVVLLLALFSMVLFVGHLYYTHTNSEHPAGGNIAQVVPWLVTQPHGPSLPEVFRIRYGPWAWARPEP